MQYIDFESLNKPCTCGVNHPKSSLLYREGAVETLPELVDSLSLQNRRCALIMDKNTRAAAGERAENALRQAGYEVKVILLPGEHPHADTENVTRVEREAADAGLLVAVGAGTIGDIARYSAFQLNIPFVTVGTALSMDGYASSVAPIVVNGFKRTFSAKPPAGLLADGEVLLTGGALMTASGVGDMAGKLISLLDWRLAEITEQEYRCQNTVDVVTKVANLALDSAQGLKDGNPESARALMSGLVISGMMIARIGNSRPASGCEHMISHFLEIRDVLLNRNEQFHGARVGVGTLLMMEIYRRFFEKPIDPVKAPSVQPDMEAFFLNAADEVRREAGSAQYADFELEHQRLLDNWDVFKKEVNQVSTQAGRVREALRLLGGPVNMYELGYSKEEALNALLYAKNIRTRFGLLRLLDRWGVLKPLATEVMEDLYDK
jgi:glycerol-1-phosphate dehydrogenase [NAD(P)+]